ncbi:hypothetical protein [Geomonas agri]|uniref:hypothetical protein n=1 Tax=Geomonas agri TaxID=2873702 RepID=UPI001CD63425|nr:hypothetical protein [Geomonas agri]
MKFSLLRFLARMLPLLLLFAFAGCGVEWFPPYVRSATSPDPFTIGAINGTEKNVDVTSAPITVSGLTAATSPISVSGATGSTYSINGGTATSSAGTVKNGDTVTVTHKSSTVLGTSTTSTLTIGDQSADFVSTTKFVQLGAFSPPTVNGAYTMTYTDVSDAVAVPVSVSIKDTANPSGAQYQVTDIAVINPDPNLFTIQPQSYTLTGKRIWVRNLASNALAVTTLTIQGGDTVVNLTVP